MNELLIRILPVFLLLFIGFIMKKIQLLSESAVEGIKTIIVTIALPVVLFDAFSTMYLQISYFFLFLIIIVYCGILYLCGLLLHQMFPRIFTHTNTKGFMTGFEFGMIGVGLFGALWGNDKLPIILLIGFGHELFIWFFYAPLISMGKQEKLALSKIILQFIKTPTIIAIVLGFLINVSGLHSVIGSTILGGGIYATIDFLTPLTSPLILIVIGFSMQFKGGNMKKMAFYILVRFLLVMSLGVVVLHVIQSFIPGLDPLFSQAYYAFILLPAPYILPLYITDKREATYFTQLLVYSTALTFIGYCILLAINL